LRLVRSDRPGLAVAHNRGLDEARGEIVAITDDDVLADPAWLERLAAGFETGDDVACVTGLILPVELESPSQIWLDGYWGLGKGFERRVFDGRPDPLRPLHPYTAGAFGSGANMAFRTEALRALGGFDPALGAGSAALGGDDLAAFFDVLAAGHRLVYEPAAIVRHRHRPDYDSLRRQAYGYGVGLTAYLARTVADDPRRLLGLVARVPRGLAHVLGPDSPKGAGRTAGFPRELTLRERRGMASGPLHYMRSRREARA
jgi:GT2 family glycosyltransferase